MRRAVLPVSVLGGAAAVAAAAVLSLSTASTADTDATSPVPERRPYVEVIKPISKTITHKLVIPATVDPDQQAEIFAKVSGYVEKVHVDIGDTVAPEQTLATIRVPEMNDDLTEAVAIEEARKQAVAAAESELARAGSRVVEADSELTLRHAERDLCGVTLNRVRDLRKDKAVPQSDLDDALGQEAIVEARILAAKAKVAAAQADTKAAGANVRLAESRKAVAAARVARVRTLMKYTTLSAPFAGVVTERLVDPGDFVRSAADGTGTPMLTVALAAKVRIRMAIPGSDAPFIEPGKTQVVLGTRSGGRPAITETITRVASALRRDTRTMTAIIEMANTTGWVLPGMHLEATITLVRRPNALALPSGTVQAEGKKRFVLACVDGVIVKRPVEIGLDDGVWAEVTGGLDIETLVVRSKTGTIEPGMRVQAVQH